MLATRHFQTEYGHQSIRAYTFGQPMVGNEEWYAPIQSTYYRFAYFSDPVTYLPAIGQYSHGNITSLKIIDAKGVIYEDATNWRTLTKAARSTVKKIATSGISNVHSMKNYIAKIAVQAANR